MSDTNSPPPTILAPKPFDAFRGKGLIIENVIGADDGVEHILRLTPDSPFSQDMAAELLKDHHINLRTLRFGPAAGFIAVDLEGARAMVVGGGKRIIPNFVTFIQGDSEVGLRNTMLFEKTPLKNILRLKNHRYRLFAIPKLNALGVPYQNDPYVTVEGGENLFCLITSGANLTRSRNDFASTNKAWVAEYIAKNGNDSNLAKESGIAI
jgi:hypothetical protein